MSDPAPSRVSSISPIANSGGWSSGATFQSSTTSIPYEYEQYWQGAYQANRGFKYLHPERIWVDNGSDTPYTFDGGSVVNGVSQTAQNPQIVKVYESNGITSNYSFNNPYYDASWSSGPTGSIVSSALNVITYTIDSASLSTSANDYYGLSIDGVYMNLTANNISHTNGTVTIGTYSGTNAIVEYKLWHINNINTLTTNLLGSVTTAVYVPVTPATTTTKCHSNFW